MPETVIERPRLLQQETKAAPMAGAAKATKKEGRPMPRKKRGGQGRVKKMGRPRPPQRGEHQQRCNQRACSTGSVAGVGAVVGAIHSRAVNSAINAAPTLKITSPGTRSQTSSSMIGWPMNSAERANQ